MPLQDRNVESKTPEETAAARAKLESKSTEALFAATLEGEYDDDDAWEAVAVLRLRGTKEVFQLAKRYSGSDNPRARARGLNVLAQLGAGKPDAERPFLDESVSIAISYLKDPSSEVVSSAAWALSHLGTEPAVTALIDLQRYPDPEVRQAVACCINLRRYILRVFRTFTREACKLGLERTWTVGQIQRNAEEFLRRFTIEAYYTEGHDKQGRRLPEMTSHINGTVLQEVEREYRRSAEWRRYERDLLVVAKAQSEPPTFPQKGDTAVPTCAEDRRKAVDAYIDEVAEKTGKRITRTEIWKAARYKTRTVFECWERCDPKRLNKAADERFTAILREKPHLK